jgi:hypothetical protein
LVLENLADCESGQMLIIAPFEVRMIGTLRSLGQAMWLAKGISHETDLSAIVLFIAQMGPIRLPS